MFGASNPITWNRTQLITLWDLNLIKKIPIQTTCYMCMSPVKENTLEHWCIHWIHCYSLLLNTPLLICQSDHFLLDLIPTYRQNLKTNMPVVTTVKRVHWIQWIIEKLHDCFDSTDWTVFSESTEEEAVNWSPLANEWDLLQSNQIYLVIPGEPSLFLEHVAECLLSD